MRRLAAFVLLLAACSSGTNPAPEQHSAAPKVYAYSLVAPLQASPSVMAESAFLSPELPDLSQLSPEAAASLRVSLLSIRDLLS